MPKKDEIPNGIKELPIKPSTYSNAYKQAKEKGKVNTATFQIHSWQSDGDTLIGRVKSIKPFEGGKFETPVNQYLIETDEGLRSTILGSWTDTQLESTSIAGKVVCIVFTGRKDLEDGRKVNIFDIEILEE